MNWNSEMYDGDFEPLTREERNSIFKTAAVMLAILAIEGLIIYMYIW